ncbi:MAG: hypothetical protein F4Z25_03020 [Chloroflexi bacterium]|nr:hypothetical protein [Chloroflexota bacterium]
MSEPVSRSDQPDDEAPEPRRRSPFLGVVGGAGEAAGDAAGSALDAIAGLASGLANALEGVARDATGPACAAGDEDCEERDERREHS